MNEKIGRYDAYTALLLLAAFTFAMLTPVLGVPSTPEGVTYMVLGAGITACVTALVVVLGDWIPAVVVGLYVVWLVLARALPVWCLAPCLAGAWFGAAMVVVFRRRALTRGNGAPTRPPASQYGTVTVGAFALGGVMLLSAFPLGAPMVPTTGVALMVCVAGAGVWCEAALSLLPPAFKVAVSAIPLCVVAALTVLLVLPPWCLTFVAAGSLWAYSVYFAFTDRPLRAPRAGVAVAEAQGYRDPGVVWRTGDRVEARDGGVWRRGRVIAAGGTRLFVRGGWRDLWRVWVVSPMEVRRG